MIERATALEATGSRATVEEGRAWLRRNATGGKCGNTTHPQGTTTAELWEELDREEREVGR